jgi:hypothetical protein
MICPKCGFEQADGNTECLKCGIIFEKYNTHQGSSPTQRTSQTEYEDKAPGTTELIKDLLFYVKPETNPLIVGARILFFLVIFVWGLKFIFSSVASNYAMESLWHLVNLPFHEAGHLIFRIFGRFMTSLGGSLGQLLMPLICLVAFLITTRDTFAASFALWWLGQNFIDLAPYINDARSLTLPLLGGNTGQTSPYGFHDWEFILKESGLIRYDHVLASLSHKLGAVLILTSFLWGGYILYGQYKNLAASREKPIS